MLAALFCVALKQRKTAELPQLCAERCAHGSRAAHKEVKVLPSAVLAGNMPAMRADVGAPKRRRKGAASGADAALCGPVPEPDCMLTCSKRSRHLVMP